MRIRNRYRCLSNANRPFLDIIDFVDSHNIAAVYPDKFRGGQFLFN